MAARIFVVTGSNKGIGYAIVRGLAKQTDNNAIIYMTARNVDLGRKATDELKGQLTADQFSKVHLHQLDITDEHSCQTLAEDLKKQHGGLDVLVNNAGFAFKQAATEPFAEQAVVTNQINYFGTKQISQKLFPLLRPHARVVNVCSQAGTLSNRYSDEIKQKLMSSSLTIEEVDTFVNNFIKYAKEGTHKEHGYPNSTYCVSKAAEIALTMIQHRQMLKDPRGDIVVNACCPGYVSTDMSSHKGNLSVDEGADTPIYLALLPSATKEPNGKFIFQRKEIAWGEKGLFG